MFERLKKFFRKVADDIEGKDDLDRPMRANPDPPKDHWFKRVEDKSIDAAVRREARRLEAEDAKAPNLTATNEKAVDDLFTRMGQADAKTRGG